MPYFGPREAVTGADGQVDTSYYQVPEFSLTDQRGETFDRNAIAGKISVVEFFYTNCSTNCPEKALNLREIQKRLDGYEDLRIISHSVDPSDDQAALQAYATLQKAKPDVWYMVSGSTEELEKLAYEGYLFPRDEPKLGESKTIALIDTKGHIRGYYDGTSWAEVKDLIEDVRMLIRVKHAPKKSEKNANKPTQKRS